MSTPIKIGTRKSDLAMWQARTVQKSLEYHGYKTQLVQVNTTGDIILDKPLYELGLTGVFTRALDLALLDGTIDLAVHSLKDVPTLFPKGIVQAAVLPRGPYEDILVYNPPLNLDSEVTIATGSIRRRAQWLHRYPGHTIAGLRGNVGTRLNKLKTNRYQGGIFAKAGLERIDLLPDHFEILEWMVPAPAQGAISAVTLDENTICKEALSLLNHRETEIAVHVERQFLRVLEGGCTAPIGALARIKQDTIEFAGVLTSLDGSLYLDIQKNEPLTAYEDLGKKCAEEILANGGEELIQKIKLDQ